MSRGKNFHGNVLATYLALMTLFFFSASAHGSEAKKTTNPPDPEKICEVWGWMVAQDKGVAGVEISNAELAAFMEGFSASLSNDPGPPDFRKVYPDVERMAKERRKKLVLATEQRNEAEADAFFRELKRNTNIVALPDGASYEIIKSGRGEFPKPQQTVNVHYVARLIDGTEFRDFGPIDMVLVTNRAVCRGWTDALQRLRKGGVMKLYVPPPLSESDALDWGIEPGSAMLFEIELLKISDTSPEALESSLAPPPRDEPLPPSGLPGLKIIEAWGWSVAQRTGIAALMLNETERSSLMKGLSKGIKGEPVPYDLHAIYPQLEEFVTRRKESVQQMVRQKRRDAINAAFADLKKNTNVVELPDGLRYEIIKPGAGAFPNVGQIVLVDYTGRLVDGTIFDRTDNEPLNVEVGSVIPGWNEGIQRINKGGKIKLYIPPELGYKEMPISGHVGPIPAGSALIYEIELLEIKDALPGPGKD